MATDRSSAARNFIPDTFILPDADPAHILFAEWLSLDQRVGGAIDEDDEPTRSCRLARMKVIADGLQNSPSTAASMAAIALIEVYYGVTNPKPLCEGIDTSHRLAFLMLSYARRHLGGVLRECADEALRPAGTSVSFLTAEQWAEPDFDPIDVSTLGWRPPTDKQWVDLANHYLVTIRVAWMAAQKTKPELGKFMLAIGEESGTELMEAFIATRDFFDCVSAFLEIVETRMICAGSAAELTQG